MTRHTTAGLALLLIAVVVLADLLRVLPNPYQAPPILALGSGAASSGGFCGSLPSE